MKMLYSDFYISPLGKITLLSDDKALLALCFSSNRYYDDFIPQNTLCNFNSEIINKVKFWLDLYFAHKNPSINDLPLNPNGTVFQKTVWNELKKIPYGKISTYGNISKNIQTILNKKFLSPQAVGQAISKNPISIIIPCHRVLNAKFQLTGYAGGLELKKKILDFEGIHYKN